MLEIEKFLEQHVDDWREVLTQKPYCLSIDEDDDYAILKYNQIDSDFTEPIVKECRGVIINKYDLRAVALSFKKFFNIQEPLHDNINWKTARVQEKVDGSKMLLWYDAINDRWRLSTSGTLDAFKANVNGFGDTFGQLFCEALSNIDLSYETFCMKLRKYFCYTFELVSPKSRIVVPYNKTKLYFIGLRHIPTFEEVDPEQEYASIGEYIVQRPKEYSLTSLDDCMKATEKMGFDEEGFVVVDDNWNRVKIKSPAYVAAHYLRNNGVTSYARILDMIELSQDDQFLKIYPEYQDKFDEVKNNLHNLKAYIRVSLEELKHDMEEVEWNRSQFAKHILENYPTISAFMFKFLDTDLLNMFVEIEWGKLTKYKKLKYLGFKEEKDADEFKEE